MSTEFDIKTVNGMKKVADELKKASDELYRVAYEQQKATDELNKVAEYTESAQKNLKAFWEKSGLATIEKYRPIITKEIEQTEFDDQGSFTKKLKKSKAIIISANKVEGKIITSRLKPRQKKTQLEFHIEGGNTFQFGEIDGINVVHILPLNTSSFTQYGSFQAVDMALERCEPDKMPQCVFSVGVAFGTDPDHQKIGDVLISRDIVFYDNFNKVTDGTISLKTSETYHIDKNLEARLHYLELPHDTEIEWHFGSILSGGTVLSDAGERNKLVDAAARCNHKVLGGEMEASGIYYACQKINNRNIPFMVIKGICDWGAVKNGWEEVVQGTQYNNDTIKDCVQAYACDNAFDQMCTIMKHLPF